MAKKKRGFFITLEGPDGSGKSTQFKILTARLIRNKFAVTQTREPGGHPLAEKIRELLLSRQDAPPVAEAELLLFLAARAQHVRDVILPALQKRRVVICERFTDSTYAYQAGGRRLPPFFVELGNRFAAGGLTPDLTLLYDLPVSISLQRAYKAKQGYDRMESEAPVFMERVRRCYRRIARRNPARVKIIDANQPLKMVAQQSWNAVEKKMLHIRERCRAL
ncbi:dTMP kinase [candidate division FCPU426 bacterium]|nr:dTMP kinase [candidate division FCPU426 bacterium]